MSFVQYAGGSGSSLLTQVQMLTGDNYTAWAIKVMDPPRFRCAMLMLSRCATYMQSHDQHLRNLQRPHDLLCTTRPRAHMSRLVLTLPARTRRPLQGDRRLSGWPPAPPARRQGDKVVAGVRPGRLRPLTGRYSTVPPSAWFQGCGCLGAFLLDGEDAGAAMSLSNFRVTCAIYRPGEGVARACAFSSAGGGRWTSGAARSSMAVYGNQFRSGRGLGPIHFAGSTYWFAFWTVGDGIVLALNKGAAEFSSYVGLDETKYAALEDKRHTAEYAYQSPCFRACLS